MSETIVGSADKPDVPAQQVTGGYNLFP